MRQTILAFFFILASCSTLPAQWQRVHLGLNYGPVYSCFTTPNALYAYSADALYESKDGTQWSLTCRTGNYGPNWIVKGMNDRGLTVITDFYDDSTLYISTDYGYNWQLRSLGDRRLITTVNDVCFLGDTIFVATSSEGIWKSWDEGRSWIEVPSEATFHHHPINYIAATPEGLYVAKVRTPYTDTNQLGISYSFNNGQTWIPLNDSLLDSYITGLRAYGSDVYACTAHYIWMTNANLHIWKPLPIDSSYVVRTTSYYSALGGTEFTAMANGLAYVKSDTGAWQRVRLPVVNDGGWSIHCLSVYMDLLVVATDHGVFTSSDRGNHWTCQQMYDEQPPLLCAHPVKGKLYLGSFQNGLFEYDVQTEKCLTVDTITRDAKTYYPTFFDAQITSIDSTVFAIPWNGATPTYMHNINSTTWEILPASSRFNTSTISAFRNKLFLREHSFSLSSSDYIIYSSVDSAHTWQYDGAFITMDPSGSSQNFYVSDDTIFVSIDNVGVYYSTDGDQWLPYIEYTQSAITGFYCNGQTMFLSSRVVYNDPTLLPYNFTLRSTDGGNSWDTTFREVVGGMIFYNGSVFASVNGSGIMVSNDNGLTWTAHNDGIEASDIYTTLRFCRSDSSVFIIGYQRVYMVPSLSLLASVPDESATNRNYIVYPNPVNTIAHIELTWPRAFSSTQEHCSVVDLCAKALEESANIRVSSVDEMHSSIAWDCSHVPNGVYVVHVTRGVERRDLRVVVCH